MRPWSNMSTSWQQRPHRGPALTRMSVLSKFCILAKEIIESTVVVPAVAMCLVAVAPHYFIAWLTWRGLSSILPDWLYQKGDDFCYVIYQTYVLFFFEHFTGTKFIFDGDAEFAFRKKEKVLYLANHQSAVDWVLSNVVAVRQGSIGHLRYVMKSSLQIIPLYGYYFYQHGCIYVRRGQFSQEKMLTGLKYLQNPAITSWLVVFPEGTRFNPECRTLIEKSEKIAKDAGLPVLKHHLTPKHRGSFMALQALHKNLDAVYNITAVYGSSVTPDGRRVQAPQLTGFFNKSCQWVYVHIERVPMQEVPLEEEKFRHWMHECFVHRDRIVEDFYASDEEVRETARRRGKHIPISLIKTLPSVLVFLAASIPVFLTEFGKKIYLDIWLYGSVLSYSWLAIKAVC